MKSEVSFQTDDNVIMVGVTDESGDYLLWQRDIESADIYFEYDDQKNGKVNQVTECTIMYDGIHLVLSSGSFCHYYFSSLSKESYREFVDGLR